MDRKTLAGWVFGKTAGTSLRQAIFAPESGLSKGLSAPGRGSMIRARTSPRSKISGGRKQWR